MEGTNEREALMSRCRGRQIPL